MPTEEWYNFYDSEDYTPQTVAAVLQYMNRNRLLTTLSSAEADDWVSMFEDTRTGAVHMVHNGVGVPLSWHVNVFKSAQVVDAALAEYNAALIPASDPFSSYDLYVCIGGSAQPKTSAVAAWRNKWVHASVAAKDIQFDNLFDMVQFDEVLEELEASNQRLLEWGVGHADMSPASCPA